MVRNSLKELVKQCYLGIRMVLLAPFSLFQKRETINAQEIERILVLRYDRIGDMVIATSFFKALRKKYPHAEIIVLASQENKDVISHDPSVNIILVYGGFLNSVGKIRKYKIDLVIDLFYTHALHSAWLAFFSGAKYRMGFDRAGRGIFFNISCKQSDPLRHMAENFLKLIEPDISPGQLTEFCPRIVLKKKEIEWAETIMQARGFGKSPVVALHPGSYYPSQRWPIERYTALSAGLIKKFPVSIVLFGSEQEKFLLEKIKECAGNESAVVFCGFSLRQFMAILARCALLVCNNSGPLHIAAALNIPTISTMGPTDPFLWRPLGENNIVLRKNLACSPCNKPVCSVHDCLRSISVEEVMQAVETQLLNIRSGTVRKGEALLLRS